LRGSVLFAAGTLAVHQLRYLVGYGPGAQDALAAHGHAYLVVVEPAVAVLVALAGGHLFASALLGTRRGPARATPRFRTRWIATSLALLACYSIQELVEGAIFSFEHPGIATLWEAGGLSAMVAAGVVGAVVALLLRAAEVVEERTAGEPLRPWPVPAPLLTPRRLNRVFPLWPHPLAGHLAGRAPPTLSH
jgi:hypothetical protein